MGISAGNKKMVGGHFISDIIDSDVLKILLGTREVFSAYVLVWKTKTFSYTGADQVFEVPEDCEMTIECWGAGSNNASGGYAKGVIPVTKGQKLSFMIGGKGSRTDNGTTYGFGGSTTYGGRGGGGLSGVFTGDTTITDSDSARALVIGGGAGGGRTGGGAGGGENGQNGNGGSYGFAGGGGTQTAKGSGNQTGGQFHGGGGSGTYGFGGGGGWYGGGGSGGDGSGDDDAQAGGGSGYVLSSATDRVLTQGGGSAAGQDGSVKIRYLVKERPQPTPTHTVRLPLTYQEVDYIESSGTQYINTGYIPNVNTEIETRLSWGSSQIAWAVFYGVTSNDKSSDGILGRLYYASDTGNTRTYNWWFCNAEYAETRVETTNDEFHDIKSKKNICTLDGTEYAITTTGTPYQAAIFLFCGNNGGSAWRYANCKMGDFVIKEGTEEKRHFVPCYRRRDGVVGMYDLVTETFYANAGTGSFTKGADVNIPELPAAYQEVKYIEQTGTQYIDTGVIPTEKTLSRIKFMNLETTGDIIYGYNPNNDTADYRFFNASGANYLDFPGGSGSGNRLTGGTCSANTIYEYEIGNFYVKDLVSGTNVLSGTAIGSFTGIKSITLGWSYANNNSSKNRWYYVQIFEGSEMIRWMIPCVRKSDSEPGMYDLVTKTFYTNIGTGSFNAGLPKRYRTTSDTLLYLPVDDDDNTTSVFDGLLKNENASWYGTASYEELSSGKRVLKFTGSQGLYLNNRRLLDNQPYTIAMWVQRNGSQGSDATIISNQRDSGNYGQVIAFNGSNQVYTFYGNGSNAWLTTTDVVSFTDGVWVQYTITVNGNVIKKYINNSLVQTVVNSQGPAFGSATNFSIGFLQSNGSSSNYRFFKGKLADLIVEKKEWTEEERTRFYEETKADYI